MVLVRRALDQQHQCALGLGTPFQDAKNLLEVKHTEGGWEEKPNPFTPVL